MKLPIADSRAQASMVDAILFMTIMLVASAVVLGSSGYRDGADTEYSAVRQYADDFGDALLALDLSMANGSWRSASQMLCDECLALRRGAEPSQYDDNNILIMNAGRNIIRPGLDFAVSCDNGSVFISGMVEDANSLPPDRCASEMAFYPGDGLGGPIAITVYVWVV